MILKSLKTALSAVFFLTGILAASSAVRKQNTITPDFAYPKTVITNAETSLNIKTASPEVKLKSMLDLTVAENLINSDSVVYLLPRIDSIAMSLPTPFSSIGFLIEAEIYADIYQNQSPSYSERVVSEDFSELNPLFWDRSLFKSKIDGLLKLALEEPTDAQRLSLSYMKDIVDYNGDVNNFTVYDFIVYKSLQISAIFSDTQSIIPFFRNEIETAETLCPDSLVNNLLILHPAPSEARNAAVITKLDLLPTEEKEQFLWSQILDYGESPYVVSLMKVYYSRFLPEISNYDESPGQAESFDKFFSLLKDLSSKIKSEPYHSEIDKIYKKITEPYVQLYYPSLVESVRPFDVNAEIRNRKDLYLLLVELAQGKENYVKASELASCKVLSHHHLSINESIPFYTSKVVSFNIEKPGRYVMIASRSPKVSDMLFEGRDYGIPVIQASDIDIITVSPLYDAVKAAEGCFVVSSIDGIPLEGAEVKFSPYDMRGNSQTAVTDTSGFASSSIKNGSVKATYNGSSISSNIYRYDQVPTSSTRLQLFLSQAVYRPGDIIDFFGIAYRNRVNEGNPADNSRVTIYLEDANYNIVDSISCVSDESGRFFGKLSIPNSGFLGTWHVTAKDKENRNQDRYAAICAIPVEIAEYKVPSFIVTLEKETADSDSIVFKGNAATYSGMPIGLCKASYTVSYRPDYYGRWYGVSSQSYSSEVFTDEDGTFRIALPLDNIDISQYRGIFSITASITDDAGETATSNNLTFWLSQNFHISASIPSKTEITTNELTYNVKVTDQMGLPVIKTVSYTMESESGSLIAEGTFESPLLTLPVADLEQGKYIFKFKIDAAEDSEEAVAESVLYRADNSNLPFETALWVPENTITVPSECKQAEIKFGSSYKGQYILCTVIGSEGTFSQRWIESDGQISSIPIPSPRANERTYVRFTVMRNHKSYCEDVVLIPEAQTEKMEITAKSFRSSISAGESERWEFTVNKGNRPIKSFAYALLYDKAMDAISPLHWNYNLFNPAYPSMLNINTEQSYSESHGYYPRYISLSIPSSPTFGFQTYGYPLYSQSYRFRGNHRLYATKAAATMMDSAAGAVMEEAAFESSADFDNAVPSEGGMIDEENTDSDDSLLRPIEMPVAFFKPDLSTNQNGELSIDFMVPNFNTTWNLLLGAYDEDLNSSILQLETVASKKVMVNIASPRFLRVGDRAILKATIYNNSSDLISATGVYEIFDPLTGMILHSYNSEETEIRPSGNYVFSTEFVCPDNLNMLGLRVYGKTEDFSDGEQTVIPVLPSSQPVLESYPFYLKPDETDFLFKLPDVPSEASIMFTYCDNPVWEVVTALSPIVDVKGASLNTQLQSFYAICVSSGLANKYPQIRQGIEMMVSGEAGDSILVSNLQKNQDLKIVSLENTPWVNNAQAETLRMSRLSTILNEADVDDTLNKIWLKLQQLRNQDGGWSWCPGMKSNRWTTQDLLLYVGMLKQKGYLPDLPNFNAVISSAFSYCDKEIINEYRKLDKSGKEYFVASLYSYLYVKSLFPDIRDASGFISIRNEAMRSMEKNWKTLDIESKAKAALIFYRAGNKKLSEEILQSLKEYATTTNNGIFYANLDTRNQRGGNLAATAQVLTAFGTISPSDPMIEGLCQWLLLQKQARAWQDGTSSVSAIDALLSFAEEWIQISRAPEISIAGRAMDIDAFEKLTGSCCTDISVGSLSEKEIVIHRESASPAWGAVLVQSIQPMEDIKAYAIDELNISKSYLCLSNENGRETAIASTDFQIGNKVRVTLTIESDRDMEFVVIADERSACLQPTEQLSGYVCVDNLWLYKEVRNSSTNLYIPFLPRGRHLITYDAYISGEGDFANGIAAIQCLYAPELTAHSGGAELKVE